MKSVELAQAMLAIGAAAALVTGCGGGSGDGGSASASSSPSSTRPSVAVPVSPAPAQRNMNGRPAVTFDPCVDVGDDVIQQMGFDPKSRARSESELAGDTYTFLGCNFKQKNAEGRRTWSLDMYATNISMTEFGDRYRQTMKEYTIGGQPAMTYRLSESDYQGGCFLAMDSSVGVLNLSLFGYVDRDPGDPCVRVRVVAEKLQSDLPR